MFIVEMFEAAGRRVIVTYPGRFQPFHLGHADVFRSLQSKFGSDNVFIVTGNKTDGEKSPFNFSDKLRFMHAAGIPDHSVVEASKPYDLPDQFQADKENIIFITAVGAPDAQRLNPGSVKKDGSPSYFQKMPESLDQAATADKHGYVIIADERAKQIKVGGQTVDVSHGTAVRNLWNQIRNDEGKRTEFLKQLYGKSDPALGHILDKISTGASEPAAKPSPKLKKVKVPTPDMAEGRIISKDELVDIYLKGKHQGEFIRKKVAQDIPNGNVNAFIDKVAKKFGLDPKAFVYGPAGIDEGWFDTAKKAATWFLKKDGDVIRTVSGTPRTFSSKEEAIEWAMKTYKVSYNQQNIVATTNPDKNLMTPSGATVAEEAAAVGVVRSSKDPRYSMSTMGDQNDVTGDTLNQMMRGYNLIGKKGTGKLKPVKGNVGKGMKESMYQYDKADPFNSEFAPDVGMGRMTLRSWKQSLARRLKDVADYAQKAADSGNIDRAELWSNIHAKMKNLNLDIIAQEIELAHKELENIRKRGGVRSRAFHKKQLEVQQLEEGWKSKLAALGLAGAAALSPMHAQADAYDDIMKPVRQVQKFKRDIGNAQRNAEHDISAQRNRVGRDLEQIPFFGIDKFGRAVRGSTNHPELQRDPAWDEKVRAAQEKREAQRQEREWRLQQDADREEWNQRQGIDETYKSLLNKYKITKESASGGATGAGAIASAPTAGAGSLFGGSYEQPQNPFRKKGKKKQ